MYPSNSRVVCGTLGVMMTVLAACADEPTPTAPIPGPAPQFAVGDELLVTNTSGGTGVGSLRWAVSQATGGEVIRFAPALAGQTITLDSSVKVLQPLTIEGPTDAGITISGAGKVRVFDVFAETVLRNLTIAHGSAVSSEASGGAGILVWVGGGIFTPLRVENSTITGNVASVAPAISGPMTTLINTTVSGNTALSTTDVEFGAVTSGTLTLVNSTIAHNTGAGVASSNLVLRNSIISNHSGKPNCRTFNGWVKTYQGGNISDDETCGNPFQLMVANPQLAPLADNGGPTRTHALLISSPAINGGASCSVSVDQRYVSRDAQCDVGAFEFTDFTSVALTMASSAAIDPGGNAVLAGTVRCSRNESFDLHVTLQQLQKRGKETVDVHAAATTPIACTTSSQSWSVALVTTDEPFQIGSAVATAGTLNQPKWVTPASVSQSVKLFKSKK